MKPLIVALDVDSQSEALSIIRETKEFADIYKVGPTLVLKYGPSIFKKISRLGKKIFLDLKFHDIPNTMRRSLVEAGKNNIYSATIHTSAGLTAMQTAAKLTSTVRIWGVTVLTSFSKSDLVQIGIKQSPAKQVTHLAKLAKQAKLSGVVASVEETKLLRKSLGKSFQIITPGIRLPNNKTGDQKRVATPAEARRSGSTFIVVGRPIVESANPKAAAAQIMDNWNKG